MQSAEIAPRIHRIACMFDETRVIYCHLLLGRSKSLLIDTGMSYTPERDILPYMASVEFDPATLDYVLITHANTDHQCGNDVIRDAAPKAQFMANNLDRAMIKSPEALVRLRQAHLLADHAIGPDAQNQRDTINTCRSNIPMDVGIEGGETIRLSPDWHVQLIHTPGHSRGHTAVYDPVSKTLIAAESALFSSIWDKDDQPALPPTYYFVNSYLGTLERLRGMDIQTFSPAHWPVQSGEDVKAFLDESSAFCLHTEDVLLRTILAGTQPLTLAALMAALKPELGHWPDAVDNMMAYPLLGNLRRLESRGAIQAARNSDGCIVWTGAQG